MMSLKGKVAVVTGGNRGIGLATARLLTRDGAAVVIAGRDAAAGMTAAESLRASGGEAIFVSCDVSSPSDVDGLMQGALSAFGGIDVLVNNAGVGDGVPFLQETADHWGRIFDTNVKGHFLCALAAAPHIANRGGGAIVNVSSVLALSTLPNCAAYTASKAAILGLTLAMAVELGPLGIRVNCVLPGPTDTEMLWAGLPVTEVPRARSEVAATVPLGRVADPAEIAEAIVWLCSDRASFVNGCIFRVDGGQLARSPSPR